jgi:hypothetical protein
LLQALSAPVAEEQGEQVKAAVPETVVLRHAGKDDGQSAATVEAAH